MGSGVSICDRIRICRLRGRIRLAERLSGLDGSIGRVLNF